MLARPSFFLGTLLEIKPISKQTESDECIFPNVPERTANDSGKFLGSPNTRLTLSLEAFPYKTLKEPKYTFYLSITSTTCSASFY